MNGEPEKSRNEIVTACYTDLDLATGEFDHSEWDKTLPVAITRHWSGDVAPDSQQAEARILWNPNALVVRFVCHQAGPPRVRPNAQLNKKVIGLWDQDVCEIFIAPDKRTPNRYFEFEAAPNGEWVDLGIEITANGRETDWTFQSGMTTATRFLNQTFTTIIRIPWSSSLPRPATGDRWRLNLFRCVGVGNERYLAWQPTHTAEPNFHVPEKFGWLEFV